MKRVGIEQLAKRLGVSKTSVSYALNGSSEVSEALRARVLKEAQRLGYQRSYPAVALSTSRSRTVGLIEFGGPIGPADSYASTVKSIIAYQLNKHAYDVLVHLIPSKQEVSLNTLKDLILQNRIEGAVIPANEISADTLKVLESWKLPVVVLEPTYPTTLAAVIIDYYQGMVDLVKHLYSRGRKSIALLAGDITEGTALVRYQGYQEGLKQVGQKKEIVACYDYSYSKAREATRHLLSQKKKPDAIIGTTDRMGVAALQIAQEMGVKVPDDMAVTGFEGSEFAEYVFPTLTTLGLNPNIVGENVAHLMLTILDKSAKQPRHSRVSLALSIRASS